MLSVIFFLHQSPLYLLKRGLSLNADLADSMRLASQLCREPASPSWNHKWATMPVQLLVGAEGLSSGPQACTPALYVITLSSSVQCRL